MKFVSLLLLFSFIEMNNLTDFDKFTWLIKVSIGVRIF